MSRTRAQARLISQSAAETFLLGEHLGSLCLSGDVILLEGPLGAGKTALTQGIGSGLGVQGVINSPTFTLVKEHMGRLPLYHIDLYRLDGAAEALDIGIDEYLEAGGICVVEWADRAGALWPSNLLRIAIAIAIAGPETRVLSLEGSGERGAKLCRELTDAAAHMPANTSGGDGVG
jgi:tRNA threonylcarbamoyladenosine biosynthesis protein TsaE